MRSQGVFNTIISGFGVASDKAYLMSKNLTQLGYDISSFFNISFEDAMQKLQSVSRVSLNRFVDWVTTCLLQDCKRVLLLRYRKRSLL